MNIGNVCFNNTDPFAEDQFSDDDNNDNNKINEEIKDDLDPFGTDGIETTKVHIRIQQRNGMKSITTIQGLLDVNFKDELKKMKKKFCCNGKISDDEEYGTVIQLQGDQRRDIRDYLMNKHNYKADNIVIHGF